MRFLKLHNYQPGSKYIEVFSIWRLQFNFDISSDPTTMFYMLPSKIRNVLRKHEIHWHWWRVTIMFSKRVIDLRKKPIPKPLLNSHC